MRSTADCFITGAYDENCSIYLHCSYGVNFHTWLLSSPLNPITEHWIVVDPIDGNTVHTTLSAFDLHAPLVCVENGGLGLLKGTAIFDAHTDTITKTVVAGMAGSPTCWP
jgi:hypothetical protein